MDPLMEIENKNRNIEIFDSYWSHGIELYESHPTSRHRRRFVRKCLLRETGEAAPFVFDYGCGTGAVLKEVKKLLDLDNSLLGGCDISSRSIELVRDSLPGGSFHLGSYPEIPGKIDIAICSEVIEHTAEYHQVLEWIAMNLKQGGLLILSTPRVPMDPPDRAYGHVQHFRLHELCGLLRDLDFEIQSAREWGFPFFTLQKWVTRRFFKRITKTVLEQPMNWRKHLLFSVVYRIYFVHNLVTRGPQLFISARKT